MRRRDFTLLVGGTAAWPFVARAHQPQAKLPLVGVLLPGNPSAPITLSLLEAFRRGLREEGFVEGQNVRTQNRYGEDLDGLRKAAVELVGLNVDVITAEGTQAVLAAKRATNEIPIVGGNMANPVADGLVASLAWPGGNVTGNTFLGPELAAKRLQLLKEIVPEVTRIAALQHPGVFPEGTMRSMLASTEEAAKASGVELEIVSARGPYDFDNAFAEIITARAGALVILPSPMFYQHHRHLVELAAKNRLPTMYVFREAVEAGGLMCYGADIPDLSRLAGNYVAKILKGARPGDLPVQQPVKFDFAINSKTAKALGLAVPPSLLMQADKVID